MKTTRMLTVPAIAAALALALSGCFGPVVNGNNNGGTTTVADITGTSWSGTDSVGDATTFEFQADGTVGVTYNENTYDDPGDTWTQSGAAVTVVVFITSDVGNATYTGAIAGDTMNLAATTDSGDNWTVVLTKD